MQKALRSAKNVTIKHTLPWIRIPTLVIGIDKDKEHPIEQAKTIANVISNSRFIEMPTNEILYGSTTATTITQFLLERY